MKKGFTLIELLVVVLIIGILSAIALPQYTRAVEKSRVAEALQMVSALQRAVDLYVLENGYPESTIKFFGKNATGKGMLAVDLNGMDCNSDFYDECQGKYFAYWAYCENRFCALGAERSKGDTTNGYDLYLIKSKTTGEWTKQCDYGETKEWMCKSLEPLGYTRSACC